MPDIEEQATLWAVRCAERPLEAAEQVELDAWLAADKRHLGAFVSAQTIWLDIDRVGALLGSSRCALAEQPATPERPWWRYAVAASLVAVVVSLVGWNHLAGRIATAHGEVRQVTLSDGSTVFLNGGTVLQVRFNDRERRILLRRGEASFNVAHDKVHPFIVSAEDISVKAVGTEFVVGLENDDVAVTVASGLVEVQGKDIDGEPLQFVRPNEGLVLAPTGPRKVMLDHQEVERRTAWRKGLLIFNAEPLGSAATNVNRYSRVRVVIDDPTLARAEFTGVFNVGDARAFAFAAAGAFNGRVIDKGDTLHLDRQSNSPSH